MILNNLLPVFLLIGAGVLLRRFGLTNDQFLRTGDRLLYYVFFPALLFWKIASTPTSATLPWRLWGATLTGMVAVFLISLVVLFVLRIGRFQAGAFSQSTYRFNTYVAIAVVGNLLGDAGVAQLGQVLSVVIPLANILAVSTLIWFARDTASQAQRVRLTMRALLVNPLILACVAGMVWARTLPALPEAIDTTLRLASTLTLPLALISIGGALSLQKLQGHLAAAAGASALKLVVLPLLGYGLLRAFGVTGDDVLIGLLFFAQPASTAMYVLATELKSDASLSAAIIVLSTVLSFFSLSAVVLLFG